MERLSKNKIHMLHLIEGLGIGGAEVLLLHYIRALGSKDYNHYVYCFGVEKAMKKKLEDLGATVYMGPTRNSMKNPFEFIIKLFTLLKDLSCFIKRYRIQIIQSHLGVSNQLGVIIGKLACIPTFPTVHNTMAFVDNRNAWDFRVHLIRAANAIIYRIAYRVIAVSQEIKGIIRQNFGLPDSRVLVLKNGIVLGNKPSGESNIENQFQAMPNKTKLIAVGSLTYQKAFEVLVKATSELLRKGFNNFLVVIAGEGVERRNIENLIEKLGLQDNVKLLGIRCDVINLLNASDIFVLPSRYEGLSIAMIEAMACGLPIIASDAPGIAPHIDHEENGLLFAVEDHVACAKSILRVVNDKNLKDRLSYGARRTFETEFNMLNNIKQLDMLFRTITAKGKSAKKLSTQFF